MLDVERSGEDPMVQGGLAHLLAVEDRPDADPAVLEEQPQQAGGPLGVDGLLRAGEPGRPRRSYQIASVEHNTGWIDPDEWKAQAPVQQGSWWEAMNAWITARSGEPVPAKAIPPDHVVCDAPGTYVMTRYAD